MNRTSKFGLMALLVACMLTACSNGYDDSLDKLIVNYSEGDVQSVVFEGEWTVNKLVVDTARLEVSDVLKVRLPEEYLLNFCYPDRIELSTHPNHSYECEGQPVMIPFRNQGYTNNFTFNDLVSEDKAGANGMTPLVYNASFTVAIDGVAFRIALFSEQTGTALYNNDTGLWTIGIPISSFYVTNTETNVVKVCSPPAPITIYYNAKKRIR